MSWKNPKDWGGWTAPPSAESAHAVAAATPAPAVSSPKRSEGGLFSTIARSAGRPSAGLVQTPRVRGDRSDSFHPTTVPVGAAALHVDPTLREQQLPPTTDHANIPSTWVSLLNFGRLDAMHVVGYVHANFGHIMDRRWSQNYDCLHVRFDDVLDAIAATTRGTLMVPGVGLVGILPCVDPVVASIMPKYPSYPTAREEPGAASAVQAFSGGGWLWAVGGLSALAWALFW